MPKEPQGQKRPQSEVQAAVMVGKIASGSSHSQLGKGRRPTDEPAGKIATLTTDPRL